MTNACLTLFEALGTIVENAEIAELLFIHPLLGEAPYQLW